MLSKEESQKIPRKAWYLAKVFYLIIRVFSFTYRIKIVGRRDLLLGLLNRGDSVVMAVWHNRMFYFATYLYRYLLRDGFKLAMMSSDSKDGEVGATIGKLAGAHVVRGSSSRRGASGLRALYRAIVKEKHSIIILPDGSKGPVYQAKVGAVALGKMTGKPIIPMSCWADRKWRIGSWDRMIIPKPFARIVVTVGEPIAVSRKADDAELEVLRQRMQGELDRLGKQAEEPIFAWERKQESLPIL